MSAALLTVAVATVFTACSGGGRKAKPPEVRKSDFELAAMELRRAWEPEQRERVIRKLMPDADNLSVPLVAAIDERDPFVKEALALAPPLLIVEAAPALDQLVRSAPYELARPALLALEQLEPWPTEELIATLDSERPATLRAVLDLCRTRIDRPVYRILELLQNPSQEIRECALAALPEQLAPADAEELLRQAEFGDDETMLLAVRALRGSVGQPKVEDFMLAALDRAEPPVVLAILRSLTARGAPLRDQGDAVWSLVTSGGHSSLLRAEALLCLERTRSFSPERLRQELMFFEPIVRFAAARCLLTAGDKEGLRVLIELEEQRRTVGFPDIEDEALREDFAVAVAQLLREVRGRDGTDDLDAVRRWYEELGELRPLALRPLTFVRATTAT